MSLHQFLDGGNITVLLAAMGVIAKEWKRQQRRDALDKEYPPHRHINGTRIMYPVGMQPPPIEQVGQQ